MKIDLVLNGNAIRLTELSDDEYDAVHDEFRFQIKNWHFQRKKKKYRGWDGYVPFVDEYNRMPVGLWNRLHLFCKRYNFPFIFKDIGIIIDKDFDEAKFREWVAKLFSKSKKKPRDYQINAAAKVLKYRRCLISLATNAGKTLVFFMIAAYLKQHGISRKMLFVTPNTQLIQQTAEELESLCVACNVSLNIQRIHGKQKDNPDVVIGNYQMLVNMEPDFFEDFDVVVVDEAHGAACMSIKKIMGMCINTNYRLGMSGSFVFDEDVESYTIESMFGPLVARVSAKYLIENDYATKVFVKILKMNYLDNDTRKKLADLRRSGQYEGTQLFALEKKIIINNKKRFDFICGLIAKKNKNSLVLFSDRKHGYGRRIFEQLQKITTGKEIYYVDGSTDSKLRDVYKKKLNEGTDKILVASVKTFSTGSSIDVLYYVFLTESLKAEGTMKQTLGRLMRLADNKSHAVYYDCVDDFSYEEIENYGLDHMRERMWLYEAEKHPYKIYDVSF